MDEPKPPRNRGRFVKGHAYNPGGQRRTDAAPPKYVELISTRSGFNAAPDGTLIRRDGWQNSASGHGTARDRRRLTRYGVDIVTDLEAQALRRSNWIAAAIIEDGPREAFKNGWHLKCEDKELDVAICKQAESLGLDQVLIEAAQKENESGGAAIFPVLEGALGKLEEELNETGIVRINAFHVFEPQELTPVKYESDINSPLFRKPILWRLNPLTNGRSGWITESIIHHSRLIIFPGIKVSVQAQPGQREGWGDSCLCRPWEVISDTGIGWGSAATLLAEHGRKTWKKKGLTSMLAQSDGLAEFDKHVAAQEQAWSALRMAVIDGDDDVQQSTGSLSGLADTLDKFGVMMAAAARRPVSVLMGLSQAGLRTGNDDIISWHATVMGDRKMRWAHGHERIVELMLLQTDGPTGGTEPESWAVEYHPLHSPTDDETAKTRYTDMQRAEIGINSGVFSADDVAESFYGGDTYNGNIHINWERRRAQQTFDAEQNGTMSPDDIEAATVGQGDQEGGDADLDQMEAELDTLEQEQGIDSVDDTGGGDDLAEVDAELEAVQRPLGADDEPTKD